MKTISVVASLLFTAALAMGATPKVGDTAPDFTAKDHEGKTWKLSDHTGKKAVLLYFYPKDNTPGCTEQACGLRDQMGDLKGQGVEVVGVSMDDADSHKKFISEHNLNFTLLPDTDGKITETYGVKMDGRNMSRRASFLIDKSGKVVHVTDDRNADTHLKEMKEATAKLAKK